MTEKQEGKQYLNSRRLAYKRTFNNESIDAKAVLADLAKFCRANESKYFSVSVTGFLPAS